jgi:dGTP triphosphohydrolase
MASDNRISIELTAAQKTAIVDAVMALKAALQGIIINLTKEERQSLPKVGDKTLAFDEKCRAYMTSRPELVPGFIDLAELAKDRKLVADLLPCLQEIAPICEGLEDTISLAYTDIYIADLAFHANVKQAAKRGVPGTDTIYDDLKERFPGRPKVAPTPPPEG